MRRVLLMKRSPRSPRKLLGRRPRKGATSQAAV
jgi:hypothetical protein